MMKSWIDETKKINSLEAEICFLLKEEFYYGPDSHPQIVERIEVEPLLPLDFARVVEQMARTSEVSGHEEELANYYAHVLGVANKHKKSLREIRQYFWLRFWLWNSEENIHIGFPWYDTLGEIERFINKVIETGSGEVFYDVDQGWELDSYAKDGFLYIRERDPDYEENHYSVCLPRGPLIENLQEVLARAKLQIKTLSGLVGGDYWSSHTPKLEPPGSVKREWWKIW